MRTNRSAPLGPVIPVLAYPDVSAAVEWLVAVLGFTERVRIGPGHRAQLEFGAGSLIVADMDHDRRASAGAEASQSVMLRVEDVNAVCERARNKGAEIVREPQDFPYGERQCTFLDPAGHRWTLTQTLHDVAPEEWGGRRNPRLVTSHGFSTSTYASTPAVSARPAHSAIPKW